MYSKNKAEQTNYGSYDIYKVNMALGDPSICAAAGLRAAEHLRRHRFDHPGHAEVDPAGGARPQPERTEPVHRQPVSELFCRCRPARCPSPPVSNRRYKGSYQPDPLTVIGHYNGVPSQPTSGL
jgi:iron complex outermembrane receptor protein